MEMEISFIANRAQKSTEPRNSHIQRLHIPNTSVKPPRQKGHSLQQVDVKYYGLILIYQQLKKDILPSSPTVRFPRSPAWRLSSSGAPCSFPAGLKCGPAHTYDLKHYKKQLNNNLTINSLLAPVFQLDNYQLTCIHLLCHLGHGHGSHEDQV